MLVSRPTFRRILRTAAIATLLTVGCARRVADPEDIAVPAVDGPSEPRDAVPGELLVRVDDPERVAAEQWAKALGRDDFEARVVECLMQTCRVMLTRTGGAAADLRWTQQIATELRTSGLAGVRSVELNHLSQPQ